MKKEIMGSEGKKIEVDFSKLQITDNTEILLNKYNKLYEFVLDLARTPYGQNTGDEKSNDILYRAEKVLKEIGIIK